MQRISDISQQELGYNNEKENTVVELYKRNEQTVNANKKAEAKASLSKMQALDRMKQINGGADSSKTQQKFSSNNIPASFLRDSFLSKSDIDDLKSMMKS